MTTVLPPRTATYDPTVVRDWLATAHSASAGYVWVGSTSDRFRGRVFSTGDPAWIDRAGAYVDQLDAAGSAGIYLRTTTLAAAPAKGRGGDHDSHTLPGLAADLDIDGPGHKTSRLPLPLPPDQATAEAIVYESGLLAPSLWVHSGGGLYAWWLLDRPQPIRDTARAARFTARWQDILRAAATRLGYHYGPVGDLSRVLRIPGTVNRKVENAPTECRILGDTGIRYSLGNLSDSLTDACNALPPAPVPAPRPRPASDTSSGLAPGDAYEASTDWADILQPHGWTLHHQTGGVRYWTRPGKERRDGFSASTGRASDRDRIYVFSDATELPSGTPLTKFAAFSHLEHAGDYRAAARELRRLGYGQRGAA